MGRLSVRSSTKEYVKKKKTKKKMKKKPQSPTNEIIEIEPIIESKSNIDETTVIPNKHSASKSILDNKAFAMFQNSVNLEQKEIVVPKSEKVYKKGKCFYNFEQFASGAFSLVYKAKDKQN